MTYVKMVLVTAPRRKTGSLSTLYAIFADEPGKDWYGYGLMRTLGWTSGKLYPLLARLESRGLLTSWMQDPTAPGRPPRRVYRLKVGAPQALPPAGAEESSSGIEPE